MEKSRSNRPNTGTRQDGSLDTVWSSDQIPSVTQLLHNVAVDRSEYPQTRLCSKDSSSENSERRFFLRSFSLNALYCVVAAREVTGAVSNLSPLQRHRIVTLLEIKPTSTFQQSKVEKCAGNCLLCVIVLSPVRTRDYTYC